MDKKHFHMQKHSVGWRALMAAVLIQGIREYVYPQPISSWDRRKKEREMERTKRAARSFLGGRDCKYYCDILEVDYKNILELLNEA